MRKILALTGIRSDYDLMASTYKAINEHPELSLKIVISGAHLSDSYGYTAARVKEDGIEIAEEIENLINASSLGSRVRSLAIQLLCLVQVIEREKPDFLLVLGDREESINTAIAGSYLNIPVAHVAGGDSVAIQVDDAVRHAVTKLAHIHLVTSEDSRQRVLKMGEQDFRVHNVGNPGLDRLVDEPWMDKKALLEWYGFANLDVSAPLLLVIQHPLSSSVDVSYRHMKETMETIKELGFNAVVSYPNSDPGSHDIMRCIDEYAHLPFLKALKFIPRREFINTMRHASCMVGNSSAGVLEAPLLRLPVVNVGERQRGRLLAGNLEFVSPDVESITAAIRKACFDEGYRVMVKACENPYGDGKSGKRIADILAGINIDRKLLIKEMTY